MAIPVSNREHRDCATCGARFYLNPRYSAAQKADARFCSRVCQSQHRRPRKLVPMATLLGDKTRFGLLTYLGEGPRTATTRRGIFECDCGTVKPMAIHRIRNGTVYSCGCEGARRTASRFTKHGGYKTGEYKSWNAMMQRCHNENDTSYPYYGAKGIAVCHQWHGPQGFLRFHAYIGERPSGMSIDRIDNDKGYEPGNVRWATDKQQTNNRSTSKLLTFRGETMNSRDWGARLGMGKNTISERLRAGWSVERALTEPAHMCGGRASRS